MSESERLFASEATPRFADETRRPLAVVTGASSGIGFELAKLAVENGFDLIVAADEPQIVETAKELRIPGSFVDPVEADLSTSDGIDALCRAIEARGRPVEALFANAGLGLCSSFLDQTVEAWRHVLDTNVTGTLCLIHAIAQDMRVRGNGRILITGATTGFTQGSFHAVYGGTKAFLGFFALALRNELKDTGVTVTCLMPGATDTEFFERADMMDTKIGLGKKADPAQVAKSGFEAMMKGEDGVVSDGKSKLQMALALILPTPLPKTDKDPAEAEDAP